MSAPNASTGVCFLSQVHYSNPLDPTSAAKFEGLSRHNHVFVVGFSAGFRWQRFSHHARFWLLPSVPSPMLRYLTLLTAGTLAALVHVLRGKASILVAQNPAVGWSALAVKRLSRALGKRTVMVIENHGDFENSVFLQRRVLVPALHRRFIAATARHVVARADVLRAISDATAAQLRRWAPHPPLFQFPTWTRIETFLDENRSDTARDPLAILYAGVLIPRKGVHLLIAAFARCARQFPNATLTIVGHESNKRYTRELRSAVRRHGLANRVRFVGHLPQAELARLMAGACALVLPSLSEGLGRVALEAMATGTPVIGSAVDGIPDVVKDGVSGLLFPPGDEAALYDRLCWILEHPCEAREMGDRAARLARERFSTEGYLTAYQELFDAAHALLTRRGRQRASSPA